MGGVLDYQAVDALVELVGVAQVAVQQLPEVAAELRPDGAVVAVGAVESVNGGDSRLVAEDRPSRRRGYDVSGHEGEQGDTNDDHDGDA